MYLNVKKCYAPWNSWQTVMAVTIELLRAGWLPTEKKKWLRQINKTHGEKDMSCICSRKHSPRRGSGTASARVCLRPTKSTSLKLCAAKSRTLSTRLESFRGWRNACPVASACRQRETTYMHFSLISALRILAPSTLLSLTSHSFELRYKKFPVTSRNTHVQISTVKKASIHFSLT